MNVRYRVELDQCERDQLTALLSGGKRGARKLKRAQILLAVDRGASDEEIARSIGVGGSTVYRTKRRFVLGNLAAALNEEPRPGARRKLTGKEEALLVATACSSPPAGRSRWTLELLAGELARLTTRQSVSRETVRRRLAETDLKPWRKDMWCIPQVDAEYVARMEDVLDLYAESPDPNRPVVGLNGFAVEGVVVQDCVLGYLVGAGTEVLAFEPERRTTMTPLRQRMIDDMRLAGFAERTRDVYIQAVRRLAAHYKRSPDVLSEEDVRAYLLHLRDERGIARGTFKTNHGGIRFLYSRTLDRDWPLFSQKNAFARRGSSACRPCSPMPRSAPSWLRYAIRSTGRALN